MDPYLEDAAVWKGVHALLISGITLALNRILPPHLLARAEERCDVLLRPETQREGFVEIVSARNREEGVTIIEVLSPTSKDADGLGQQEYRRKQQEILQSPTHLLEIDLLRSGAHTILLPRAALLRRRRERYDYLICLHRALRDTFECWPFTVREPMPIVPVPVSDDPREDVPLNLQPLFDDLYDGGRYALDTEYRREPDPPLSPEEAIWADALLRTKGLRAA